jgi:hypothetical protein
LAGIGCFGSFTGGGTSGVLGAVGVGVGVLPGSISGLGGGFSRIWLNGLLQLAPHGRVVCLKTYHFLDD